MASWCVRTIAMHYQEYTSKILMSTIPMDLRALSQ